MLAKSHHLSFVVHSDEHLPTHVRFVQPHPFLCLSTMLSSLLPSCDRLSLHPSRCAALSTSCLRFCHVLHSCMSVVCLTCCSSAMVSPPAHAHVLLISYRLFMLLLRCHQVRRERETSEMKMRREIDEKRDEDAKRERDREKEKHANL